MSEFTLENKIIGSEHPTYFIADIAANHDGDIERAKELIYKCAEAGADAAKFQHFEAKTIVRKDLKQIISWNLKLDLIAHKLKCC